MSAAASTPREISLLIVDDHRIFAEALSLRMRREAGVGTVTLAYCLDDARALAARVRPDVVVLDYDLDGELGTDLIPCLRDLPHPPQIVMLSATDAADHVVDAIALGASAWVLKEGSADDLLLAASEVLNGHMYLSPTTVRPVIERLLTRVREHDQPTFLDELSKRQREVLQCLAAGMTRAETAQHMFITTNTVRTHVQHLLRAAGVHSTLALVARARELGVSGLEVSNPGSLSSP